MYARDLYLKSSRRSVVACHPLTKKQHPCKASSASDFRGVSGSCRALSAWSSRYPRHFFHGMSIATT